MANIDPVKEEIARLQTALLGEKDDVVKLRAKLDSELKNLQTANDSRINTAEQIARKCRDSRSDLKARDAKESSGPRVKAEVDLTSKFAALRATGGR